MMSDFYSSYLGLRSIDVLKAAIFEEMVKLGADVAQADYSGGNDEGGVDGVSLFRYAVDANGERKLEQISNVDHYEHPLHLAFDELLGHDFGSWAGEYQAEGTVTANLIEQTITREGQMQTYDTDETGGVY